MIFLKAFLVGGLICGISQIIIDRTKLTPARILVGMVISGVILGAVGAFEPMYNFAKAGVSVPLLGFGANMVKGVREAVDEKGLLGVLTGPLSAAAAGTTVAILCGVVASVIAKPKDKLVLKQKKKRVP